MSMIVENENNDDYQLNSLLNMEPLMPEQRRVDMRTSNHNTRRSQTILQEMCKMETAEPKVHVYHPELFENIMAC